MITATAPQQEIHSSLINKETTYKYAEIIQDKDSIWISGQLGYNDKGELMDGMEAQIKCSYHNLEKILALYNMTLQHMIGEILCVTDMAAAIIARRKMAVCFSLDPRHISSTIIHVDRLPLAGQLVEMRIVAIKHIS